MDLLHRGRILPWHDGWGTGEVPADLLFDSYVKHAGIIGERRKSSETTLGSMLQRLTEGQRRKRRNRSYGIPTGDINPETGKPIMKKRTGTIYIFPDLAECRRAFEKVTRTKPDWDDEDEDAGPGPGDEGSPF